MYISINGEKYMDTFLLRTMLELTKSQLQHLLNTYNFPDDKIIKLQNRKLYKLSEVNEYLKMVIMNNEQ